MQVKATLQKKASIGIFKMLKILILIVYLHHVWWALRLLFSALSKWSPLEVYFWKPERRYQKLQKHTKLASSSGRHLRLCLETELGQWTPNWTTDCSRACVLIQVERFPVPLSSCHKSQQSKHCFKAIFQDRGNNMAHLVLFLSQVKSSITFKLGETILNWENLKEWLQKYCFRVASF